MPIFTARVIFFLKAPTVYIFLRETPHRSYAVATGLLALYLYHNTRWF